MAKQGDLCDIVSLFIFCTDGTVLLIFNSNPSEFWIPGIRISPNSNIQREVSQEINDVSRMDGTITSKSKLFSVNWRSSKN